MPILKIFKELKKNSATSGIKVFIMTNQQDSMQWPQNAKPDKFLIKAQTTPTELISLISKELK